MNEQHEIRTKEVARLQKALPLRKSGKACSSLFTRALLIIDEHRSHRFDKRTNFAGRVRCERISQFSNPPDLSCLRVDWLAAATVEAD